MRGPRGGKLAVVDTNVAVVSNDKSDASDACVEKCILQLRKIMKQGILVLDEDDLIFDEYKGHLSFAGQPGVGDMFMRWVHTNRYNPKRCALVALHKHNPSSGGFEEFPDVPELKSFDRSDRVFVAVALACEDNPAILAAVDTDWWLHRDALERNGATICFLCPEIEELAEIRRRRGRMRSTGE